MDNRTENGGSPDTNRLQALQRRVDELEDQISRTREELDRYVQYFKERRFVIVARNLDEVLATAVRDLYGPPQIEGE